MKKRDLEILKSLEKFKCLERDQIATLHFAENKNPKVAVNRVLKRLRDNSYLLANTNRSFQQYIYFLNPSPIKTDSQKIDHYLLMNQTVIDMMKYSTITDFQIESSLPDADFIPDIKISNWLGNDWFIECQNSLYTTKQLYSKLNKYVDYYNKGYWNNERVLIVGKVNLKFDSSDYPFKIKQVRCIEELSESIKKYKEIKFENFKREIKSVNSQFKSENGQITIVL